MVGKIMLRNELLAALVLIYGGTVTDPDDRNALLQDWIDALKVLGG